MCITVEKCLLMTFILDRQFLNCLLTALQSDIFDGAILMFDKVENRVLLSVRPERILMLATE